LNSLFLKLKRNST